MVSIMVNMQMEDPMNRFNRHLRTGKICMVNILHKYTYLPFSIPFSSIISSSCTHLIRPFNSSSSFSTPVANFLPKKISRLHKFTNMQITLPPAQSSTQKRISTHSHVSSLSSLIGQTNAKEALQIVRGMATGGGMGGKAVLVAGAAGTGKDIVAS